eukprot:Nk52_evm10s1779 gene=Nk52_evmTU10s1779
MPHSTPFGRSKRHKSQPPAVLKAACLPVENCMDDEQCMEEDTMLGNVGADDELDEKHLSMLYQRIYVEADTFMMGDSEEEEGKEEDLFDVDWAKHEYRVGNSSGDDARNENGAAGGANVSRDNDGKFCAGEEAQRIIGRILYKSGELFGWDQGTCEGDICAYWRVGLDLTPGKDFPDEQKEEADDVCVGNFVDQLVWHAKENSESFGGGIEGLITKYVLTYIKASSLLCRRLDKTECPDLIFVQGVPVFDLHQTVTVTKVVAELERRQMLDRISFKNGLIDHLCTFATSLGAENERSQSHYAQKCINVNIVWLLHEENVLCIDELFSLEHANSCFLKALAHQIDALWKWHCDYARDETSSMTERDKDSLNDDRNCLVCCCGCKRSRELNGINTLFSFSTDDCWLLALLVHLLYKSLSLCSTLSLTNSQNNSIQTSCSQIGAVTSSQVCDIDADIHSSLSQHAEEGSCVDEFVFDLVWVGKSYSFPSLSRVCIELIVTDIPVSQSLTMTYLVNVLHNLLVPQPSTCNTDFLNSNLLYSSNSEFDEAHPKRLEDRFVSNMNACFPLGNAEVKERPPLTKDFAPDQSSSPRNVAIKQESLLVIKTAIKYLPMNSLCYSIAKAVNTSLENEDAINRCELNYEFLFDLFYVMFTVWGKPCYRKVTEIATGIIEVVVLKADGTFFARNSSLGPMQKRSFSRAFCLVRISAFIWGLTGDTSHLIVNNAVRTFVADWLKSVAEKDESSRCLFLGLIVLYLKETICNEPEYMLETYKSLCMLWKSIDCISKQARAMIDGLLCQLAEIGENCNLNQSTATVAHLQDVKSLTLSICKRKNSDSEDLTTNCEKIIATFSLSGKLPKSINQMLLLNRTQFFEDVVPLLFDLKEFPWVSCEGGKGVNVEAESLNKTKNLKVSLVNAFFEEGIFDVKTRDGYLERLHGWKINAIANGSPAEVGMDQIKSSSRKVESIIEPFREQMSNSFEELGNILKSTEWPSKDSSTPIDKEDQAFQCASKVCSVFSLLSGNVKNLTCEIFSWLRSSFSFDREIEVDSLLSMDKNGVNTVPVTVCNCSEVQRKSTFVIVLEYAFDSIAKLLVEQFKQILNLCLEKEIYKNHFQVLAVLVRYLFTDLLKQHKLVLCRFYRLLWLYMTHEYHKLSPSAISPLATIISDMQGVWLERGDSDLERPCPILMINIADSVLNFNHTGTFFGSICAFLKSRPISVQRACFYVNLFSHYATSVSGSYCTYFGVYENEISVDGDGVQFCRGNCEELKNQISSMYTTLNTASENNFFKRQVGCIALFVNETGQWLAYLGSKLLFIASHCVFVGNAKSVKNGIQRAISARKRALCQPIAREFTPFTFTKFIELEIVNDCLLNGVGLREESLSSGTKEDILWQMSLESKCAYASFLITICNRSLKYPRFPSINGTTPLWLALLSVCCVQGFKAKTKIYGVDFNGPNNYATSGANNPSSLKLILELIRDMFIDGCELQGVDSSYDSFRHGKILFNVFLNDIPQTLFVEMGGVLKLDKRDIIHMFANYCIDIFDSISSKLLLAVAVEPSNSGSAISRFALPHDQSSFSIMVSRLLTSLRPLALIDEAFIDNNLVKMIIRSYKETFKVRNTAEEAVAALCAENYAISNSFLLSCLSVVSTQTAETHGLEHGFWYGLDQYKRFLVQLLFDERPKSFDVADNLYTKISSPFRSALFLSYCVAGCSNMGPCSTSSSTLLRQLYFEHFALTKVSYFSSDYLCEKSIDLLPHTLNNNLAFYLGDKELTLSQTKLYWEETSIMLMVNLCKRLTEIWSTRGGYNVCNESPLANPKGEINKLLWFFVRLFKTIVTAGGLRCAISAFILSHCIFHSSVRICAEEYSQGDMGHIEPLLLEYKSLEKEISSPMAFIKGIPFSVLCFLMVSQMNAYDLYFFINGEGGSQGNLSFRFVKLLIDVYLHLNSALECADTESPDWLSSLTLSTREAAHNFLLNGIFNVCHVDAVLEQVSGDTLIKLQRSDVLLANKIQHIINADEDEISTAVCKDDEFDENYPQQSEVYGQGFDLDIPDDERALGISVDESKRAHISVVENAVRRLATSLQSCLHFASYT